MPPWLAVVAVLGALLAQLGCGEVLPVGFLLAQLGCGEVLAVVFLLAQGGLGLVYCAGGLDFIQAGWVAGEFWAILVEGLTTDGLLLLAY